jgi:hypothetical protein
MVGADLAELSKLVSRLNGPDRQQLTTTLNEMNAAVQDSADWWVSEYGDRFRHDFDAYVTKTQDSLRQMLAQAARITGQNLGAIATATGNGSGQSSAAGGGQLELTADTLSTGSLTNSLAADSAADGSDTQGSAGAAVFARATQEFLEGDAAAYAGFAQLESRAISAFTTATKSLWNSPAALHEHVFGGGSRGNRPPHGPEFNTSSEDEYAKISYDFLQDAARKGYPAKVEGNTFIVYDQATKTFAVYRDDGGVRSIYKLTTNPTKFTDSAGRLAQPGELDGVAAKAAATVDDTSWLAKAGRLADTPIGRIGGKAMTGLAVAGDLLTIADPSPDALGGPDTERIMAAANLAAMVVTAGPVAGLLTANAALDWIPGVGEVVLAATALYFVGDLVYENRQAIGHALSWAGHESAHIASGIFHDIF